MRKHKVLLKYIAPLVMLAFLVIPKEAHGVNFGSGYDVITATPETSFEMAITGEYFPVDNQEVLDYINKERKEATDKGYFGYHKDQYRPLKWNSKLEQLARERAIEASIYPIHSRTSGENPSNETFGENLAWFSTNTMENVKLLMSEKNYYLKNRNTIFKNMSKVSSQEMEKIGHYYAFVNPANKYVGVATFQMDINSGITPNIRRNPDMPDEDLTKRKNYGVTAISFAVNNYYGTDETVLPSNVGKGTYNILVSSASFLELRGVEVWWPSDVLTTGNAYQIKAKATTYYNDHGAIEVGNAPIVEGNWQSSNPEILTVDRNGVVKAISDGTATITFSVKWAKDMTASKTFTVEGGMVSEVSSEPIAPTSDGVKYGNPVDRAVDLAPDELLDKTNMNNIKAMVTLWKKLKTLPELNAYKIQGLGSLYDDFKLEIQNRQQSIDDMERVFHFAEYIDASLANVNKQDNLTALEKQAFKEEIVKIYYEKVKHQDNPNFEALSEEVRQIVKKSEVKNYENSEASEVAKEKPDLLSKVEGEARLTSEEQAAFMERINSATSLSDLQKIKEDLQKTFKDKEAERDAANKLLEKKTAAKESLGDLSHLTSEERNGFASEIDSSQDEVSIEAVLNRAKTLDDEKRANEEKLAELSQAKEAANTAVSALSQLTNAQKEAFGIQMDNAVNKEEVLSILKEAQDENARLLDEKNKEEENNNQEPSGDGTDQGTGEGMNQGTGGGIDQGSGETDQESGQGSDTSSNTDNNTGDNTNQGKDEASSGEVPTTPMTPITPTTPITSGTQAGGNTSKDSNSDINKPNVEVPKAGSTQGGNNSGSSTTQQVVTRGAAQAGNESIGRSQGILTAETDDKVEDKANSDVKSKPKDNEKASKDEQASKEGANVESDKSNEIPSSMIIGGVAIVLVLALGMYIAAKRRKE